MITVTHNPRTQTLNGLLEGMFQKAQPLHAQQGFTPAVDLYETQAGFTLEVALPGVKKEDIVLEFQEGVLTISGKRALPTHEQEKKYHRVENLYGAFKRSFRLPDQVNGAAIEASAENGVLQVWVPKDAEKVAKRQITVK